MKSYYRFDEASHLRTSIKYRSIRPQRAAGRGASPSAGGKSDRPVDPVQHRKSAKKTKATREMNAATCDCGSGDLGSRCLAAPFGRHEAPKKKQRNKALILL
jgi:hypothetical protein